MSDIEEDAGPSTAIRQTPVEPGSPLGPKPAKFGANKESMEWLVKNTNAQLRSMDAKLDTRFNEIIDLLRNEKGKDVIRDPSPSPRNFPSNIYLPDRTQRQATHETQPSNMSARSREMKIKREDIGLFDPHHEDPDDKGIIVDGKNLFFTDIFAFGERIDSFLEEPDTKDDNERQIVSMFQTLLAGSALLWWNNELNYTTRTQLRSQGLNSIMEKLQTRFLPDAAQASDKFTMAKLSLRDIAQDESALVLFIQKKLRYARAMGLLAPSSINWHSVMVQIWSSMSLDIRQYLRAPLRTGTLASYMLQAAEYTRL